MKLKIPKISKEARILLGLMVAAAAVLIWINFFTQQRQGFNLFGNQSMLPSMSTSVTPGNTSSTAIETPEAISGAVAMDPTVLSAENATSVATEVTAIDPTTITSSQAIDEGLQASVLPSNTELAIDTQTLSGETASAEVAVDGALVEAVPLEAAVETALEIPAEAVVESVEPVISAPTASRDIQLAELPFLVTEVPVATDVIEESEEQLAAEVIRPGEQRASINPFAPIVLKPVEVASVPLPQGQDIVEVPIPSEPVALSTVEIPAGVETVAVPQRLEPGAPLETAVPETPLPEALTPAPEVASLPRPLPGGTLPVAPDILRTMSRTMGATTPMSDPVELTNTQPEVVEVSVAIRLPDQPPIAAVETSVPSPISTEIEDLEPITGLASAVEAVPNGGPIAAGLSGLSRYLRDNNVRFTGSVIGPVAVGIFRSNLSQAPYVITLGQSIPNTDIVLTNLQGKQAQFTQGHEVQSLTLDLRR